MTCTNCHGEIITQSVYCPDCGSPVVRLRAAPRMAGFWRRATAVAIDLALFAPLILIVGHLAGVAPTDADLDNFKMLYNAGDQQALMRKQIEFMLQFGYLLLIVEVLLAPYYILMEHSAWQATVGKRIVGIQVTGMNDRRISLGTAVKRYFARNLSALPAQAGFIMAGFTKQKQTLHDLLCGTLVVIRRKELSRGPEW
jgi:uncharacterized RDD family membrane protein YckC